jgi:hypothetical protein
VNETGVKGGGRNRSIEADRFQRERLWLEESLRESKNRFLGVNKKVFILGQAVKSRVRIGGSKTKKHSTAMA